MTSTIEVLDLGKVKITHSLTKAKYKELKNLNG